MEAAMAIILILIVILVLICACKLLNWLWLRPKRFERLLREQGLKGNRYRLLVGDSKEFFNMRKEALSKPMTFSHDIAPRVFSYDHHSVKTHGKNCVIWFGPTPRVTITDPELIKDAFNKMYDFRKPNLNPQVRFLAPGLASYEEEKWSKHRKIINPAFNLEKLKNMLPLFTKCCDDMISKCMGMLASTESCEIDVWPFIQNFGNDVISQTAFGSSCEEGRKIFHLLKELAELTVTVILKLYIPGWRFVPTTINRRMKEINRYMTASFKDIINKREKELKAGKATKSDLLNILLESNHKEIEENGSNENVGISLEEVIEECKLFYFAGQETTSSLLVWTMILLGRYTDWQSRAREEVLQVFGNQKPDFDKLNQLKIVTMILYEVLRLYPPIVVLALRVHKDVKLGNLSLPAGVQVSLPIVLVHHDCELWGDDAKEFKPERFSEGVVKATNGRASFFSFWSGSQNASDKTLPY